MNTTCQHPLTRSLTLFLILSNPPSNTPFHPPFHPPSNTPSYIPSTSPCYCRLCSPAHAHESARKRHTGGGGEYPPAVGGVRGEECVGYRCPQLVDIDRCRRKKRMMMLLMIYTLTPPVPPLSPPLPPPPRPRGPGERRDGLRPQRQPLHGSVRRENPAAGGGVPHRLRRATGSGGGVRQSVLIRH